MQNYIYDHYGYIVEDENALEFDYKNFHFKLEFHDKNEEELIALRELVKEIDRNNLNIGVDIVENSLHQLGSIEENYVVSLVAVKLEKISINDFIKMNRMYLEKNKDYKEVSLEDTRYLWEKKIDYIENEVLKSLSRKETDYHLLYSLIYYYVFLGENALSYLIDIIYDLGPNLNEITIAHKRIIKLDSFELLNPFNLILDSPMRDLSELYKNGYLDNESLLNLLRSYNVNKKEVMLLFARILFPSDIFDILEEQYENREKNYNKILLSLNKQNKKMKDISKLHLLLINNFEIRPIDWLII